MKWPLKRRGNIILIIGIILAAVIVGVVVNKPKSEAITQAVEHGRLEQTVEVTGDVETITELDLAFEQGGTIATVLVEEGEDVSRGDVLATLSAADAYAEVARAQANLDLQLAGSRSENLAIAEADVTLAENAVESAESEVEFANSSLTLTTSSGAASVSQAEISLAQTEETNSQNTLNAAITMFSELEASVIEVRSALSEADKILGIENDTQNSDFEFLLGATDTQTYINAQRSFESALELRDSSEDLVFSLDVTSTDIDIDAAITETSSAIVETSLALLYTREVLDDVNGNSAVLTIDDLNAFKAAIDLARNSVLAQETSLASATIEFNDSLTNAENALETAQSALTIAQSTAEISNLTAQQRVATADNALIARQNDLIKARANLDILLTGPRDVDLAPFEADLQAAQARLAKTQIISPIDGSITLVDVKRGEQAVPGQIALGVQASGDQFFIPVNIPESDIGDVNLNDSAVVTLDSFGDDRELTAKVVSIDTEETIIEGVTYYQAKVVFDGDQDLEGLRSGMSADVTIVTDVREDTLFLPQRAVLERDGTPYVRIQDDSDQGYVERTVSLGIRGDDGLIEILSGVEEGEEVIVSLNEE